MARITGFDMTGGTSNNIFERCNIHHIGRLGANPVGAGIHRLIQGLLNNLFINNDVHDNDDELGSGGNPTASTCRPLVAGMSSAAIASGATPTTGSICGIQRP